MKVKEHKTGGVTVSDLAIKAHGNRSDEVLQEHSDESPISKPFCVVSEFGLDLSN